MQTNILYNLITNSGIQLITDYSQGDWEWTNRSRIEWVEVLETVRLSLRWLSEDTKPSEIIPFELQIPRDAAGWEPMAVDAKRASSSAVRSQGVSQRQTWKIVQRWMSWEIKKKHQENIVRNKRPSGAQAFVFKYLNFSLEVTQAKGLLNCDSIKQDGQFTFKKSIIY